MSHVKEVNLDQAASCYIRAALFGSMNKLDTANVNSLNTPLPRYHISWGHPVLHEQRSTFYAELLA